MTPRIRVLVADDERPSRSFLVSTLRTFDEIEIVGEASNGGAAIKLIETLHPDVAFLDVQMPGIDGFRLMELLPYWKPFVVFVTAHDEHATRAFKLNAVDYLLKPVSAPRLRQTLDRVRTLLELARRHTRDGAVFS